MATKRWLSINELEKEKKLTPFITQVKKYHYPLPENIKIQIGVVYDKLSIKYVQTKHIDIKSLPSGYQNTKDVIKNSEKKHTYLVWGGTNLRLYFPSGHYCELGNRYHFLEWYYYRNVFSNQLSTTFKINAKPVTESVQNYFIDRHYKLEIWPSNKIPYAYLKDNYGCGGGTLNNSCMRHKDLQKSLNMYKQFNTKIVVITDNRGKIFARALYWENVNVYNTSKIVDYLDRIYYTSEKRDYPLYREFVKEKKCQAYTQAVRDPSLTVFDKDTFYIDGLDCKGLTHCPYTDTFKHLFFKDGVLTGCYFDNYSYNKIFSKKGVYITLSQTSDYGYRYELDPNSVQEEFTENWISKKNAIKIKQYDGYVLKKHIVDINGKFYSKFDNALVSTTLDGYILRDNLTEDFYTFESFSMRNGVWLTGIPKERLVHKKYVITLKGDIYNTCCKRSEYHIKSKDVTEYKGQYYLSHECYTNYNRFEEEIPIFEKDIEFQKQNIRIKLTSYVATEKLTPKKHSFIMYDLYMKDDNILFTPIYVLKDDIPTHVTLYDGTLIRDTKQNREFIKKRNKYYYLKTDMPKPEVKYIDSKGKIHSQLLLTYGG